MNEQHGLTKTSEYRSWKAMKERCLNPNNRMAKHYSEKGVSICPRWINSFVDFYSDMGEKSDPNFTIERINGTGNYEPGNCKWASNHEQQRNKCTNIYVEVDGEKVFLKDYAKIIGLPYSTLGHRYRKGLRGNELFGPINQNKVRVRQPIRKFSTPVGLLTVAEIAKVYHLSKDTVRRRACKGLFGADLVYSKITPIG